MMIRSLLRALPAAALLWGVLPAQAQDSAALAAVNKLADGGFELRAPSYWTPTGALATWPITRVHSGTHSIALGGATTGAASWTQSEVVRNWVSKISANSALFSARAWVYTEGVNTNPTTDAGKYQMVLTFKNAAGAVIGGQDLVTDVPQTASGTNGWVQIQSQSVSLPEDAVSVTATVRRGATATGTVWFDDFAFVKDDGNTLTSWHGGNVDLSGDWFTYWPGFDGSVSTPRWSVGKTVAQQHTGAASLRIERLGTSTASPADGESVVISPLVPITPGRPVVISFWLKTEGSVDPSTIGTGTGNSATDNNVGLSALWYSSLQTGRNGYDALRVGGADIRLNGEYNSQVIPLLPRQAANGWTQYSFVLNPLPGSVGLELRLRYWHQFTGVTYWDDVFIGDAADVVTQIPNLLAGVTPGSGGFEDLLPSYWTRSDAALATWPITRVHSGTHSIALGGATTGAASWTQSEVVRNWVSKISANSALFSARAWVYTEGVNTNPTTDAGKYQMVLTFKNAAGTVIGGQDLVTDVPQTASGTNGWVQIQSQSVSLPEDAVSVTATVRRGATATGTVWFDDFAFVKDDGNTLTSWHGGNVDLSGDWFTYWPGFDGSVSTPRWSVGKTVAQQHTGAASLRIERLGTSTASPADGESVAISALVPVSQSQPVLISYWLKTEGSADPSTIGTGGGNSATDNNVGLSALWYSSLQTGRNGYDALRVGGADIRLNGEYNSQVIPLLPRQAANGWTNYAFVLNPLPNSAGLELRLRYWHQFTGATYWDDIAITNIAGANLFNPVAGEEAPAPGGTAAAAERWMSANTPNPFSASTEIQFALPAAEAVTIEVYDLLGRRVALLADDAPMTAGGQTVTFERGDLPSGSYLVVLRTPSHSEARQITVVR